MEELSRRRFLHLGVRLGVGALAGMSVLGASGCGGSQSSKKSGPINLSVMGTDPERKKYYAKLTKAFQQKNDHKVKPVYVGWEQGQQKLTTQVGGGDPPDASYLAGRWLAGFANMGALSALDPSVTEGFIKSAVDGGKYDGKLYGMPWGFSTRALFYRTDLFEKAGLSPPKSWDEMLSAAKKLNDPSGKVNGFGIAGLEDPATAAQFMTWLWAAGGEVLSEDNKKAVFDSPEGVEALTSYAGLVNDDLSEPGAITNGEGDLHALFRQGRLAMVITGPWMRSLMKEEKSKVQMDKNAGVVPVPPWKTQATVATVDTLSVFSEGEPKAATDFLKFAGRDEWVYEYARFSGQQPVTKSVANKPEFQNDPYWSKAFLPSVDFARPYPNVPAWPDVENALISAVQKAIKGTDPKKALDEAAKKANSALKGG